jgi:hypothetical protein
MAEDWYVEAGQQRLNDISAQRSQAMADLEAAKVRYDSDGASDAIQRIADCDAQRANLMNLYNQYWHSQNPPAPPPQTKEQLHAKPWEQMNYADVWEMSRSKYGPPDEGMFRAGMAEAARRRARGE